MAETRTGNYQQIAPLSGFSLLETLIAVSLLAFVASVAVHMMITTQDSASQSQIAARDSVMRDSLAGYVGHHFRNDTLTSDEGISDLSLSGLTAELDQDMLQILPVIGNYPRYQNGVARCRLAQNASLAPAEIAFAADCILSDTNTTLASLINTGWNNNVPVIFGLAGGTAPCESASAPSATGIGEIADLSVTDAACLISADNITATAGTEIIFPRYMVFDRDAPQFYYRALLENIAQPTTGASLSMPASISAKSGLSAIVAGSDLSSLSETLTISLRLATEQMLARLSFENSFGAQIQDNNSASVTLTGTISQIANALDSLHYRTPDAYFGANLITASARVSVQQLAAQTAINVTPNCGNQTAGTAIRFDLGHTEDGTFELVDYVTSVSLLANLPPQRYYGYCNQYHRTDKPRHLYDQDSGLRRLPDPPFSCSGTQDPAQTGRNTYHLA